MEFVANQDAEGVREEDGRKKGSTLQLDVL